MHTLIIPFSKTTPTQFLHLLLMSSLNHALVPTSFGCVFSPYTRYNREYMARMNGEKPAPSSSDQSSDNSKAAATQGQDGEAPPKAPKIKRRSKKWAEAVPWENNEQTTLMYQLLENNDLKTLERWLTTSPDSVHIRSEDGRGPLWWANEFGNQDAIRLLKYFKVRDDLVDSSGQKP